MTTTDEREDGPVDERVDVQVDTQVQEHDAQDAPAPDGPVDVAAELEAAGSVEEAFDRVRERLHAEEARLAAELERNDREARAVVDATVAAVKDDLATQADRVRAAIAEQREAVVEEAGRMSAELDAQADAEAHATDGAVDGEARATDDAVDGGGVEHATTGGDDEPTGTEVTVEDGEVTEVRTEDGDADAAPDADRRA
ncbi:hypothetical protein AB6N23_12320 [Cellulomonas sp. 179-A 9B4 NHS]|uniref:hypothetical protein n=1 Tax=Cellulomonas sp. 179-A 9B4 NHS TaxID=3142379 RepID=UPI0039A034F2